MRRGSWDKERLATSAIELVGGRVAAAADPAQHQRAPGARAIGSDKGVVCRRALASPASSAAWPRESRAAEALK